MRENLPWPLKRSTPGRGRLTAVCLGLWALVALGAVVGCDDDRQADGTPCTTPTQCVSGLCLDRGAAGMVCAQRCGSQSGCSTAEVCGRFDYRGRDDGGLPVGPLDDIVQVCRAPLNARCTGGCAAGGLCLAGPGADGVCTPRCEGPLDCDGRRCVTDGCVQYCAPPCDDLRECPRSFSCDLASIDRSGHGQCIPIAGDGPGVDLGDASCPGDP